jgi:hypothetical protein
MRDSGKFSFVAEIALHDHEYAFAEQLLKHVEQCRPV